MAQDMAYFKAQAERCRRLAKASAEREAHILNDMAAEFDLKAAELGETRPEPHLRVPSEA